MIRAPHAIFTLAGVGLLALTLAYGVRAQRAVADAPSLRSDAPTVDQRRPVRLLPMMAAHQKENMRDHLLAVQQIVAALAADDFAGIAKAAGRIGYSDAMAQMCTHMGAATPGFMEMALNFHRTADTIADAARNHDRSGVLTAINQTLQACTGCHAAFRQEVVDEATWKQMTSTVPSSGPPREP